MKATNIFHELAEMAFIGRYHILTEFNVASDLPHGGDFSIWWNITEDWDMIDMFYNQMNPEEQALALLFLGEMYSNSIT